MLIPAFWTAVAAVLMSMVVGNPVLCVAAFAAAVILFHYIVRGPE